MVKAFSPEFYRGAKSVAPFGVVEKTHEEVFRAILNRIVVRGALKFFTAETGLGKTTGARLAMIRVWQEVNADTRFLVLVPTKKDADVFYQEMEKLEPGCAAVWTQSHDPTEDVPTDFPISAQFTKGQAVKRKCLILTHNAGKAAEQWVGRRDVVIIDEYPQPVSNGVVRRYQFVQAQDEEQSAPYASASKWAEEQDEQGLRPLGVPAWVYEVLNTSPASGAAQAIKVLAEHMVQGTAFQRRIGNVSAWYWYNFDLPFEEKAIVFSATAHLEGWHFDPMQGGAIERDALKVDYSNMVAKYIPWPAGVSPYHNEILKDPDQREAFVSYIAEKIGLWGDKTLVVCPKDLEKDIKRRLKSSHITHYGCDVGSNEYRECDKVWLVSLFHLPADVLFAKYLGHSKQSATEEALEPGQNTQSRTVRELKRLHYSTHIKQMAARGTCRNVDRSGVADYMELNCVFPDRDLFTELLPELFQGVNLTYEEGAEPWANKRTRSLVARITELLRSTERDEVTAADLLAEGIKIKGKPRKDELESKSENWRSIGWSFFRGEPGRYGKPASFKRLD